MWTAHLCQLCGCCEEYTKISKSIQGNVAIPATSIIRWNYSQLTFMEIYSMSSPTLRVLYDALGHLTFIHSDPLHKVLGASLFYRWRNGRCTKCKQCMCHSVLTWQGQCLNPRLSSSKPMPGLRVNVKLKNSGVGVSGFQFQLYIF